MIKTVLNLAFGVMPVLAFAQTEVQSGRSCGYLLVENRAGKEWATAWYRDGDSEWCHGHYFASLAEARADFINRAAKEWKHAVSV